MGNRFLVELYVQRGAPTDVDSLAAAARVAAEALSREGTRIRCLRSMFVPEDETCFLVFEAADREHVLAATNRAGLTVDRIVEYQEQGAA